MNSCAKIFTSFFACILKSVKCIPITSSWQSAFHFDAARTSRNPQLLAVPGRTHSLCSGPGVEKFEMKFPKLFLLAAVFTVLLTVRTGAREMLPWLTDLSQAQVQAKTEGKWVLIHFTGSDWCGWCMKLHKDVFQKAEFESYAKSNLVLVSVDFPKRKLQAPTVQQANQKLAAQYQVQGPPTLIVLDSQGRMLGKLNYGNGGAKAFLAELEKVIHAKPDVLAKTVLKKSAEPQKPPQEAVHAAGKRNELELIRISGPRQRRQALINEQELYAGQTATFHLASGRVKVRCVEVRERSVLILVGGEKHSRELRLTGGT